MFETLADHIRHDEPPASLGKQFLRWAMVTGVAVALFGALYLVMQHLEH